MRHDHAGLRPLTEVSSRVSLVSLSLLAALPVGVAVAADEAVPTIGEIVVTAQRREESNLQVGVTLTALSAQALAEQRITQVTDLQGRVPSLDIKEQVPGAMPVITIRGVGLNDFGAAN